MIDIRQTPQYAKYLKQIGWQVERITETNYFIKKVPLMGSVLKLQRPEELRYSDIRKLSTKYKAFQIIVEPKKMADGQWLMANGFKLSKSPYLPTKTLQLNLIKTEKELLAGMKKDTRRVLRPTMHHKLSSMDSRVEEFRNVWKKTVGIKRYVPPLSHLLALKNSFKEACKFYVHFDDSNQRSKIAGGAIFLRADKIAYYWQAFTNKEGRRASVQYQIVWQGILWAKKRGAGIFDFEGIYDKRFPNKSWLGFTHFKKSFGGYEVTYPGCYTRLTFLR